MDHVDPETALALHRGQLLGEAAEVLTRHIAGCPLCSDEMMRVASVEKRKSAPTVEWALPPVPLLQEEPLTKGQLAGRYLVLDRLGVGGMGVVYSAYDPELDRRVALKVLNLLASASGTGGQARLQREAQAMARLSHPNVVAVHDVSTWQGQVFLAMEYLDGGTLKTWLEVPRAPGAIIDTFLAAGRGLAAAHRAGIVHRDFKPDNVLVAKDGRIQVTDFGLARPSDSASGGSLTTSGLTTSGLLATPVTQAGAVIGTPAYMAPEQHQGTVDARADQFAFCVALHEAFAGKRPFLPADLEAYARHGKVPPPIDSPRSAPAQVKKVLGRGLALDPALRFASMDELLAELARNPAATGKRWALIGVTLLATAAVGAVAYQWAQRQALVCKGAERKLAGLWDSARRRTIEASFVATGLPFAQDAFRGASAALDAYASGVVTMTTDACEATRVRKDQTEEVMERRQACLDGRLKDLSALTALFEHADAKIVERAVLAVGTLPSLTPCADGQALRTQEAPPSDPLVREKADGIQSRISAANALSAAGKWTEAVTAARVANSEAASIGYAPLGAQAHAALGNALMSDGKFDEAETVLNDAIIASEGARLDELAAEEWGWLLTVNVKLARYDAAERVGRFAQASLARIGGDERIAAQLLYNTAQLFDARGKYADQVEALKKALAIRERVLGPDAVETGQVLYNLALASQKLQKPKEGRVHIERCLRIYEKALGARSPAYAKALGVLGSLQGQAGNQALELETYQRQLEILEKSVSADHPDLAAAHMNVGNGLADAGRLLEALEHQRKAVAIREKVYGAESPRAGAALINEGYLLNELGLRREGLTVVERVVAITEKVDGPDHPNLVEILFSLGEILRDLGELERATQVLTRAVGIGEKGFGVESADLVPPLVMLGSVRQRQGKLPEAQAVLQRARAIVVKEHGDSDHPLMAMVLAVMGEVEKGAEAVAALERAVRIDAKAQGDDSTAVALMLVRLAKVRLVAGDAAQAAIDTQRALTMLEKMKAPAPKIAMARFGLASARWAGGEHTESRAAAHVALAVLEKSEWLPEAAEVRKWLAARPGR